MISRLVILMVFLSTEAIDNNSKKMSLSLNEALSDPDVLEALQENPASFRFKTAPTVIMTMVPYYSHVFMRDEDFKSQVVKDGIPADIPIFGPMSHMVDLLSTSLNFTFKIVVPPDNSWGSRAPDGTWSGMVGQVYRREVDMGIGPFTTIQSRYEAVDMTSQFVFDTLGILSARGSSAIDPWGFLYPLTAIVWGSVFLALLGACFVHFVFEALTIAQPSLVKLFGSILFVYMQPPVDHALTRTDWRKWQRPLVGSWILVSLLINMSYGGNLKSMMALRYISHPIQTVRDLIEDTSKKIIIEHRSSFLATVKRVPYGDIKEMNEVGEAGRYADYPMRDFMNYAHRIVEGDHVQIFDTITSLYYRAKLFSQSGRCDFYLARETFIPIMFSMTIQKHSPITPAVNERIRRVFEAGLYNLWISNHIANSTACASPPMIVTSQDPIHFENIWGVAVIWGVGMLLATFAWAVELIWAKLNSDTFLD